MTIPVPGGAFHKFVRSDAMRLNVINTGRPFALTSGNTAEELFVCSRYMVTWDVAGTSTAPINVSTVRILFSADGGTTFPDCLSITANDGQEEVRLPNVVTSRGRIKIEAVGNVFFDISNANLSLVRAPPEIDNLEVDYPVLFPPDGRMRRVKVNYESADKRGCGYVHCMLINISLGDELNRWVKRPVSSRYARVVDNHTVQLRATPEKDCSRIYIITLLCIKDMGTSIQREVRVRVPRSLSDGTKSNFVQSQLTLISHRCSDRQAEA